MVAPARDQVQRTRVRVIIVVLVTLCPVVCYISRLNLSLAIVAMIVDNAPATTSSPLINNSTDNSTTVSTIAQLDSDTTCPLTVEERSSTGTVLAPLVGPKYNWTNEQAAMIQGAFFWTYVGCQIPVARAAEVFGPRWILAAAGLGSAVFSFLAPVAADAGAFALTLTRFGMGAAQTALYPASYIVYTKWLPPDERSLALPLLYMGAYVGSIISSTITGYLCESSLGWPSAFYLAGIVCAAWTLLWLLLSVDNPRDHAMISHSELVHIEFVTPIDENKLCRSSSNNASGANNANNSNSCYSDNEDHVSGATKRTKRLDWGKIIRSLPIIGFTCVFFSSMWSFSVIMILLPSYLNFVLRIPILMNGIISSTIFALFCVASPLVGALSAWLVHRQLFGLTKIHIRKLFEGVAIIGQGVCFFALPLMGCNQTLVLVLLAVQILVYSLVNGGEVHQPSELSLDFAGTIYAIANTVGMSTGFLVPMIHGWAVDNRADRHQWNVFWIISGFISTLGGVMFVLLAKSDELDLELKSSPEFETIPLDDNGHTSTTTNLDDDTNC